MYRVLLAVALLALTFGFAIAAYAQAGEKPPLSAMRITGEVLAGGVGELAVYLTGKSLEPLSPFLYSVVKEQVRRSIVLTYRRIEHPIINIIQARQSP